MSVRVKSKLRTVYGKPLSALAGRPMLPKPEHLRKAAKIILECVREEIRKDVAKANSVSHAPGSPIPIPNSSDFQKSFYAKVMGQHIEIGSDWPFAEEHLEGRQPFRMTWLTQVEGVTRVPIITRDGFTVVRMAPMTHDTAWIHPGFLKYTFLERGVRKGREKAAVMLAMEFLIPMLATRDILL